jgi:hypothetical protein
MPEDLTDDYSAAHFRALSEEEQDSLQRAAEHLTGSRLEAIDDEILAATFNILRPTDGCLPDDEIGDDLIGDVRRKFACLYYPAVQLAEEQLAANGLRRFDDFAFCLDVDPSYEGTTHVAVVDLEHSRRPYCYFHHYAKPWHFSFENLKDIAQEVLRAKQIIVTTFLHLKQTALTQAGGRERP